MSDFGPLGTPFGGSKMLENALGRHSKIVGLKYFEAISVIELLKREPVTHVLQDDPLQIGYLHPSLTLYQLSHE